MSDEVWWTTLLLGLALAGYAVRVTLFAPREERPQRWCLLALTAALGVVLGGWVFGWDSWPGGLVAGLAVTELGPAAWAAGRRLIARVGGKAEP